MKTRKILGASLATALLLAACGGGSTLSGNATGPTKTSGTTSVKVSANPASIAADGSTSATITAIARDVNNAGVAGVAVTFGVSSGLITPASATTDTSGTATAKLTAAGVAANTNITVAAAVGTVQGSTTVSVVAIQQSLTLVTSTPQIPSDSSSGATISALLKDANNNVLPGVAVKFSTSSGAVTPTVTTAGTAATPIVPAGTTDLNGIAQALVTAGNDPTNRNISVTAMGGSAPAATIPLTVKGTSLALSGPANLVIGNQGNYTAVLVDSSLKGIPNTPVTLTSANGNTLSAGSVTTDANGKSLFTLTATSTANSGVDTLTAKALSEQTTTTVTVSSDVFAITAPPPSTPTSMTKVDLGFVYTIVANWKSGGNPKVGQTVNFAASRGTLSAAAATTDASGNASVTIKSTTAGQAVIDAAGAGVSAQASLDFVATNPTQLSLQASPAAVPVQGTSTLTATVRDPNNNLVEDATVNFALTDSTGGTLSVAAVTTDTQGRASTTYKAGNTTSSGVGVIITATVPNSTATGSATLTVGGQSVFLSLGTGNKVGVPNVSQYQIQFAVQAVDAQGAALSNVPLTLRILPNYYKKGKRSFFGGSWMVFVSTPDPPGHCPNEDTDYSGNISSLDPANTVLPLCTDLKNNTQITQHTKDLNCDGILWPGNIATVTPDSGVTDATGTLLVLITYPQDHAEWLNETLTATTVVAGTESSASATYDLPVLAADVTNQNIGPPGAVSPYGFAATCSDPR